jgi:hypothetical protein
MQVMWGILLFVAGAITIIYTFANKGSDEETNVSLVLSISLAIVLFAYGFTIVFSSFLELKDKFYKYEIIIGAFIVAVGIVFVMNIDLLKDIIVSLIAASMLVFGATFIARTILAFAKKMKVWWMGLCIAFAVLFVAAGVLCLIFKDDVTEICYLVLGGVLVVVGAIEIYITIKRAIEGNNIGIEQKQEVKDEPKKNKKDKKKKKEEPQQEFKRQPEPEVFDNEVAEEVEEPKAIPEFDASSSDEDKNELIVKE